MNGIVFSAYDSKLSYADNHARDSALVSTLKALKIPINRVEGIYKGKRELSILVPLQYDAVVFGLAKAFDQESILVFDSETKIAELFHLNNEESIPLIVTYFGKQRENSPSDKSIVFTDQGAFEFTCEKGN